MSTVRHHGYFDERGKLQAYTFVQGLNALRARRVPVVLTVEEFKDKRSSQANRYYHGVVLKLIGNGLADMGWEPHECSAEAVHESLKRRFLTVDKPVGSDGLFLTRTRSTTELDTQEFGAYLEHCIRFAAEYLNVVIPPPGEQMEIAA